MTLQPLLVLFSLLWTYFLSNIKSPQRHILKSHLDSTLSLLLLSHEVSFCLWCTVNFFQIFSPKCFRGLSREQDKKKPAPFLLSGIKKKICSCFEENCNKYTGRRLFTEMSESLLWPDTPNLRRKRQMVLTCACRALVLASNKRAALGRERMESTSKAQHRPGAKVAIFFHFPQIHWKICCHSTPCSA